MKLKYIEEINNQGDKIIMLYEFDTLEARLLYNYIFKLILGEIEEIKFSDFDFVLQENCDLVLKIGSSDIGITKISDSQNLFICELTRKCYRNMGELIQAFDEDTSIGYQWLYNINNPIDFLFSSGGTW